MSENCVCTYLSKDTSCSSLEPSSALKESGNKSYICIRNALSARHNHNIMAGSYPNATSLWNRLLIFNYITRQCKWEWVGLTERRDPALALATDSFSFSAARRCTAWKLLRAAEKSFMSRSFWIFCCLWGWVSVLIPSPLTNCSQGKCIHSSIFLSFFPLCIVWGFKLSNTHNVVKYLSHFLRYFLLRSVATHARYMHDTYLLWWRWR